MKPGRPTLPSPSGNLPAEVSEKLPAIIQRAGANAVFAAQEFFFGTIRNEHTQRAYLHAVKRFLTWAEKHGGGELNEIAPGMWGSILPGSRRPPVSPRATSISRRCGISSTAWSRATPSCSTCPLRPGERYSVMEGKTPEIPIPDARKLLASMDTSTSSAFATALFWRCSSIPVRAPGGGQAQAQRFYHAAGNGCCTSRKKAGSRGRFRCGRIFRK